MSWRNERSIRPSRSSPAGGAEEAVRSYQELHKVETLGGMVEVKWEPGLV